MDGTRQGLDRQAHEESKLNDYRPTV